MRRLQTLLAGLALALAAGASAFEPFVVRDIRVEGLRRIAAGTVFNYLPVKVGERLDERRAAEAVRALFRTGFFSDVRLARDGEVLVVEVVERPAIAEIRVSGNRDIDTEELLEALKQVGFAKGRVFNRAILDRVEQELRRQYFARGKYGVRIRTTACSSSSSSARPAGSPSTRATTAMRRRSWQATWRGCAPGTRTAATSTSRSSPRR